MMIKTKVLSENGVVSAERNDYWNYYLIRISGKNGEDCASIKLTEKEWKSLLNNMIDIFEPAAKYRRAK